MSETVNASIRFGGKLNYDKVDELLDLINEKRLGPDWDMVGEVTRDDLEATNFYGSSEVSYGNLDELTSFCEENGLSYEYDCGAGSEWDGSRTFYNAETGESREFVGEQDEAITLKKIKELGSYEAVLAYFDTTLPPFEIVGELPFGDAPIHSTDQHDDHDGHEWPTPTFTDEEKATQKHNAQMLDGCETEDELNAELRAQTQGN